MQERKGENVGDLLLRTVDLRRHEKIPENAVRIWQRDVEVTRDEGGNRRIWQTVAQTASLVTVSTNRP
jgi:hypothetical protein